MQRLILGYAPANIVPAAIALGSIAVFTRVLEPKAFGEYSLAFSVMMVLQAILFYGPTTALTRFYAHAVAEQAEAAFLKLVYGLMLCFGIAALAIWSLASWLGAHSGSGGAGLALVMPLLLLRSLVVTNQTVNRADGLMLRLNVIECLHAVIGAGAGVLLVAAGWHSGDAVMTGLLIGAATCAAIDVRRLACLANPAPIDRKRLREIVRFVWPLMLAWVVLCSLQYADRFIVDSFAGAAQLAVYVVAFSLVDRPITLICMSVTAGTFQVAVDTYVRDGAEAGRMQAGRNGAVLLGLALPACAGLMLESHSIASVLVGPALRGGVAALVPVMAVTSLLRGVSAHFVDHAFHLSNASIRLFFVYLPSAAANIALSALLVPRYGMIAAAYGALACQAMAVLAGWWSARGVLPLWLPRREIGKIGLCLVVMVACLLAAPLPTGAVGLIGGMTLGIAAYLGSAAALDLGGLRKTAQRALNRFHPVQAEGPACPR
jgi:O-antigen/teichoic acid export membrane protein